MRVIVVAGAKSKIGKTTTLRIIKSFLDDVVAVKLGKVGEIDKGKPEMLLPYDSSFADIEKVISGDPQYLLVEGNAILNKIKPDLAFFVEAIGSGRKDDADEAKKKCDLTIGEDLPPDKLAAFSEKMGLSQDRFNQLLEKLKIQARYNQDEK